MHQQQWYSIWDLERLYRLEPRGVLAALTTGQLRGRRVRDCWQVSQSALEAWLPRPPEQQQAA